MTIEKNLANFLRSEGVYEAFLGRIRTTCINHNDYPVYHPHHARIAGDSKSRAFWDFIGEKWQILHMPECWKEFSR